MPVREARSKRFPNPQVVFSQLIGQGIGNATNGRSFYFPLIFGRKIMLESERFWLGDAENHAVRT